LAGEIESTRQPTGLGPYYPPEVHTAIAAKGTYRAEQRRWLRFAGLNFFGVIGPGFVNRSVQVEGIPAGLPPGTFCFPYGCTVQRRQTATMLDYGGGFEVVPARPVAIRFDVTHASFSQPYLFSNFSQTFDQHRTYLKVALMLRLN
jgi:hypothetical protein